MNDRNTSDAISEVMQILAFQTEVETVALMTITNDELCARLLEESRQPNAFRMRLVARRRALGQDDGVVGKGTASGKASSAHRPSQKCKTK
jgi:hypothetical protein